MQSMYKGDTPFTREQLVFVVQASIHSTLDKIDGCLPQTTSIEDWEQRREEFNNYCAGAIAHFGIFVPILWAQTEGHRVGDGMGTCDFIGWDEFEKLCYGFIEKHTTEPIPKSQEWPKCEETRAIAEKIVDDAWKDYFADAESPFSDMGCELNDGGYISFPESNGDIDRRDQYGDRMESRSMDEGEHWKEWRDLFTDDALYFQPEEAGDPDCETSAAKIKSFDVYRNRENAEKAHPDCEIEGFTFCDIEKPRFLDVENPTYYYENNDPRKEE